MVKIRPQIISDHSYIWELAFCTHQSWYLSIQKYEQQKGLGKWTGFSYNRAIMTREYSANLLMMIFENGNGPSWSFPVSIKLCSPLLMYSLAFLNILLSFMSVRPPTWSKCAWEMKIASIESGEIPARCILATRHPELSNGGIIAGSPAPASIMTRACGRSTTTTFNPSVPGNDCLRNFRARVNAPLGTSNGLSPRASGPSLITTPLSFPTLNLWNGWFSVWHDIFWAPVAEKRRITHINKQLFEETEIDWETMFGDRIVFSKLLFLSLFLFLPKERNQQMIRSFVRCFREILFQLLINSIGFTNLD